MKSWGSWGGGEVDKQADRLPMGGYGEAYHGLTSVPYLL